MLTFETAMEIIKYLHQTRFGSPILLSDHIIRVSARLRAEGDHFCFVVEDTNFSGSFWFDGNSWLGYIVDESLPESDTEFENPVSIPEFTFTGA